MSAQPSDLVREFINFTSIPSILDQLLAVPFNERPTLAASLFNQQHPTSSITPKQAKRIGETWYIENGKIYRITPEIKKILGI